jgi:hypothetical protein
MPYELRTLRSLASDEVTDCALAQTLCYRFSKQVGNVVLQQGDLYRICLQDHKILELAKRRQSDKSLLTALLTYVVTHELVHVVRFGQHLQRVDLPFDMRQEEEHKVERTTRAILAGTKDEGFGWLFSNVPVKSSLTHSWRRK